MSFRRFLFTAFAIAVLGAAVQTVPQQPEPDEVAQLAALEDPGDCTCPALAPAFNVPSFRFSFGSEAQAQQRLAVVDAGVGVQLFEVTRTRDLYLQCKTTSCFKLSADAGAPDCTLDTLVPGTATGRSGATATEVPPPTEFSTGGLNKLAIKALDGGDTGCVVFQRIRNN